jgi:excisionase family DNA binding protein
MTDPRPDGGPYTAHEVAAQLRVSYELVCALCRSGRLASYRIEGRGGRGVYRVTQQALDAYLARATEAAVRDAPAQEYVPRHFRMD